MHTQLLPPPPASHIVFFMLTTTIFDIDMALSMDHVVVQMVLLQIFISRMSSSFIHSATAVVLCENTHRGYHKEKPSSDGCKEALFHYASQWDYKLILSKQEVYYQEDAKLYNWICSKEFRH